MTRLDWDRLFVVSSLCIFPFAVCVSYFFQFHNHWLVFAYIGLLYVMARFGTPKSNQSPVTNLRHTIVLTATLLTGILGAIAMLLYFQGIRLPVR